MGQALSVEIYQLFEDKIGREAAEKVAAAITLGFEMVEKRAEDIALQKKLEIKDELTETLATKADLQILRSDLMGEIQGVRSEMRAEIQRVRNDLQVVKIELEGRIGRIDQKLNFLIVLMFLALTLMNPLVAEALKRLLTR